MNVTTANASSGSPATAAGGGGGGDVAAAASAAVEASSSDAAAAASSSSHNTVADGGGAIAGVGGMKDDKDLALLPGIVKIVYYVIEYDMGPCTYDVRKIFGISDPHPPLVPVCPIFRYPPVLWTSFLDYTPPPSWHIYEDCR